MFKIHRFLGCLFLMTAVFGAGSLRAQTPEELHPEWGKAADNKIFAQKLVNETLARHPELIVLGVHAIPPGASAQCIIAINLDRIGKLDDPEDIGVIVEHKIILEPNLKDATRFEVQLAMNDAEGRLLPVGLAVVFDRRKTSDEPLDYLRRALAIRDEMSRQVAGFATLFSPVP